MKKQIGIQKLVLEAIKDSKRMHCACITKNEIISQIEGKGITLNKPSSQVSQALFHLQKTTKYRRPRIKRIKTEDKVGWTVIDDKGI